MTDLFYESLILHMHKSHVLQLSEVKVEASKMEKRQECEGKRGS